MPGDGEAVRLIADALDQARGRTVRLGRHRAADPVDVQPLLAGTALGSFGYSDEREIAKPELGEHVVHFADLPDTTVDEEHIRRRHFAIAHVPVAPLKAVGPTVPTQ